MQYTPVIPPAPGTQSPSSRQRPPVVPTLSPSSSTMPPWAIPQQFPFVGPHVMGGTPSSYHEPPLVSQQQTPNPAHAPVNNGGFSADWTGFPTSASVASSPYVQAASPPQSARSPAFPPHSAPATGYNAFQQPLPGYGGFPAHMPPAMHPAMWPMMGMGMPMTPFMMAPPGWGGTPYMPPGVGLPPQAAPVSAPPPAPAPAPPQRVTHILADQLDKVDKFAEGPHCE